MSNKGQTLQDPFLNALRKDHVPVSIYLVNGIKLQGQVESFDQYVVLLRNTVTQMVYKHAISTVLPPRPVASQFDEPSTSTLSAYFGLAARRSFPACGYYICAHSIRVLILLLVLCDPSSTAT